MCACPFERFPGKKTQQVKLLRQLRVVATVIDMTFVNVSGCHQEIIACGYLLCPGPQAEGRVAALHVAGNRARVDTSCRGMD